MSNKLNSKHLKKQLEFIRNLNDDYKKSIIEYTKDSTDINNNIRKKIFNEKHEEIVNDLRRLFELIPVINESITVYRGLRSYHFLKSQEDNAYISTSMLINIADNFLGGDDCCLLQITIQPGAKILPIFEISAFPKEREILLGPGRFEITGETEMDIENETKIVKFVEYISNELQITDDIKDIKDPGKDDRTLVVERCIKYVKEVYMDYRVLGNRHEFSLDKVLETIEDKLNLKLTRPELDIIRERFNLYRYNNVM